MTIRVKLIGCDRYSYKGELFEKAFEYELEDPKARTLLTCVDDHNRPYFVRVEIPTEIDEEIIVTKEERSDVEGVRVHRTRGRPRKNPAVKTQGDSAPLTDDSPSVAAAPRSESVAIEV